MRRLFLLPLALILLAATAHADRVPEPTVAARRVGCTTEPAPAATIVKVRAARGDTLRLRVVGAGPLCDAQWSAVRGDHTLAISAVPNVDAPSLCGTCAIDLTVKHAGLGRLDVTVAGTTVHARR